MTPNYFQKLKNNFVEKSLQNIYGLYDTVQEQIDCLQNEHFYRCMKSGSKEWINALVYKDMILNKDNKILFQTELKVFQI